ncbi:hypothetical protein TIFTF001_004828 [Ficus carica]|uniref:Major facilitator superfamily (MFS) profile domain-containing protein n=1 Tax=Ficus carica TaxID=3494 RepID=A0AA87ZM48_FICCA|nr:hypothetical protein TIFTF001_004828 [Ficus carica]
MALKVLSALDSAKTQWYHFKAIIIAGMGLFTDAYDLFCIAPIMRLLGHIYYNSSSKLSRNSVGPPGDDNDDDSNYQVPAVVVSMIVGIALVGTVIGKLVFGRLGDLIGRRRVYGLALMLMVLSSIGCGFSICTKRGCVLVSLGFFRFLLGVGIGGDYPLSATIMSEFANKRTRGSFIAAVFSMQGIGILASSAVTMVVCKIFEATTSATTTGTPEEADIAWRIILMVGAVPAAMTYYWRMMMPETARFHKAELLRLAAKDMVKVLDVSMSQIAEDEPLPDIFDPPPYPLLSKKFFRRHGRDLFACAASWFLVDIVFYSNNLFQSHVYSNLFINDNEPNAFKEAYNVARLQAIVAICSTIPGVHYYSYWEKRKHRFGFIVLYGLTFFFSNFGPNTTTFIVPAELFPARFRSTCHGIAGAAGKVGAIIGSVGFLWASHNKKEKGYPKAIGMTMTLIILGGVCLVGMVVTYLFTFETKGRSLEENEKDDIDEDGSDKGRAVVGMGISAFVIGNGSCYLCCRSEI